MCPVHLHIFRETAIDETFIKGLIKIDGKLIFYLDIVGLIAADEAIEIPDHLIA